jgi:hypothetical protein
MTNLSFTAQEVYDAFICTPVEFSNKKALAAAIRAAANQLADASSAHTLYAIAGELDDIPHLSLNPKIPTDS